MHLLSAAPYDALPIYTSNPALVCAPTNQTATPCRLMPSSLYTPQFARAVAVIQPCTLSAYGPLPGAVKCSSEGNCASAKCGGLQYQLYSGIYGPGG